MTVPNPGTRAARAAGCTCAVIDNNHGQWPPWPPDGWWITEGCPVHISATPPGSEAAETLTEPQPEGQP